MLCQLDSDGIGLFLLLIEVRLTVVFSFVMTLISSHKCYGEKRNKTLLQEVIEEPSLKDLI